MRAAWDLVLVVCVRHILARVVTAGALLGVAVAAWLPSAPLFAAPKDMEVAQTTAALPAAPPKPAIIEARFGIHPDKTRFVLELSSAVAFRVTTASHPDRVIVDLPDLSWSGRKAPMPGQGLVRQYSITATAPGASRLLLETKGPVQVIESLMLPEKDGHQPRLVLDLRRAAPSAATRSPAPTPPPVATRPVLAIPENKPDPAPARVVPAALPTAPPAPPTSRGPEKPLIVIDPGHGGEDPGAIGIGGVYEKNITLAMARALRQQLEASKRYRVMLTRDKDVFIRLRERVGIARDAGADLFISLHADSITSGSVHGLSIYTLSDKASDHEAESLAAKENRSDAIAGLDLSGESDLVASILIDLAQHDTMNHSKRFAKGVLENVRTEVSLLSNKPQRQAGFAVLTAPDVPSALIEMGYLSNAIDVNKLTSPLHRERLARGVARAVDSYFKWLGGPRKP